MLYDRVTAIHDINDRKRKQSRAVKQQNLKKFIEEESKKRKKNLCREEYYRIKLMKKKNKIYLLKYCKKIKDRGIKTEGRNKTRRKEIYRKRIEKEKKKRSCKRINGKTK